VRNIVAKHSGDSWGHKGRWQVNLTNTCATIADREDFTVESVIHLHNIIVIHEISHALSGVRQCWSTDGKQTHWDKFLQTVV